MAKLFVSGKMRGALTSNVILREVWCLSLIGQKRLYETAINLMLCLQSVRGTIHSKFQGYAPMH
jgi:hypothetical protein